MFYSLGIYFDSNWELPNTPSIGTLQIVHLNEYKIEENCWNFIYKLSSAPPSPLAYRLPRQNNLFTCLQRWNTGGEKKEINELSEKPKVRSKRFPIWSGKFYLSCYEVYGPNFAEWNVIRVSELRWTQMKKF